MPASNTQLIFVAIAASMLITGGNQQGFLMDTETLQIMANTSVFKYALELQKTLYSFSYKVTPANLAEYFWTTTFDSDFADGRQGFWVDIMFFMWFEEARLYFSLQTIAVKFASLYRFPISDIQHISSRPRETEITPSSILFLSVDVRSHLMKRTNSSVTRSMEMDAPQTSTSRDQHAREFRPPVMFVAR